MDRSNSVSSTSSSTSRHDTEPFAYQTRILARTSSTSRQNSALPKAGVLKATSSHTGSRRWAPSHRAGTSIDSVRGKWEERARTEAALNNQSSPSRSSFSTDDTQSTAPSSPSTPEFQLDSRPSPPRSFHSTNAGLAGDKSSSTPTLLKRHTMPDPIVASPLSPNSTGISVVSPEPLSFSSISTPATQRIHFPMSSPSVASRRQKFDSNTDTLTGTDSSSTLGTLSSRSGRSVDFDSIMKDTRSPVADSLNGVPSASSTEDVSPGRLRSTSLYGSPHFSTPSRQDLRASMSQDRFTRPSSPDKAVRPSSPDKSTWQMNTPSSGNSALPSFPEKPTRQVNLPSADKVARQSSLDSSRRTFSPTNKQDLFTPSSPDKSVLSKPITLPRRNSVKDSPFLRPSSPALETSSNLNPSTPSYRPPPVAPSSFSNASSSAMSPTPYRSSYMANKKAGAYGDISVVGRRLGRHLPRIASGDGNEDPEPEPEPEPEKRLSPMPEKVISEMPAEKSFEEKSFEPNPRLQRLERREKRLREWKLEMDREPLPPPKTNNHSPSMESFVMPHSSDDVAGIPGRKRLSRDVVAPPSPLGGHLSYSSMPLPSSRMGVRGGLWADTQRHLLRAYEYLCHVGEAQQWIEGCLGEELGFGVVEMEESLRNGVVLAKLSRVFLGEGVVKRIFEAPKLDYRQTDNINHFFFFIRHVGLPECFIFETTDLYNKKNIPKVIYCIHALSHLLARRGLAERIGNLLGQLKFSDDQLQRVEKGLKDAGVPMPNFGAVGRELAKEINEEPEVEVETEEERRDRLLLENEESIVGLQAVMRGFLVRKDQATHHARMRLAERYIVRFQARCRGVASRQRTYDQRKQKADFSPWILAIQTHARGLIARRAWQERLACVHAITKNIIKVQAQSRGILERRRFARLRAALVKSKVSVLKLQAAARAKLVKKSHQQLHKTLGQTKIVQGVVGLQAASRALLVRRKIARKMEALKKAESNVISLQAHVRGLLVRRHVRNQLAKLDDAAEVVVRIQAAARCYLARKRLLNLIRGLRRATPAIVAVQAFSRANLQRKQHKALNKALGEVEVISAVGNLQALARATLVRKKNQEQSKKLEFLQPDIVGFQAVARGALVRRDFIAWRDHLRNSYTEATHLQALFRGLVERRKFTEKMKYYRANLEKVIKIQSLYRAKETRDQYRQLTLGHNVNVGTIKNFVHLLDDSEADFEDEIEVERLRKRVVQSIRANQALETEVNELDVKIALVVQNVKSFEELIKARRRNDSNAANASRASVLAAHGDPFAGPSSLDHETKRKLELYQQLFYLLQTRSDYLGKLFHQLAKVDIPAKNKKLVERVVLMLFGYGQDRREEYLLLKLFQTSVRAEIAIAPSVVSAMQDIPIYLSYRIAPLILTVINTIVDHETDEKLDLETDPCIIYRSRINIEEMKTGMRSNKPKDISYRDAVMDPDTRAVFIRNLQRLHALSRDFVNAIVVSTKKMPYGMRFLLRELLASLKTKFPNQTDEDYTIPLGKLLFFRYINPAIVAPETFDIVPNTIDIADRKNLAQISKMLSQITQGKEFGEDDPCLSPLNKYVAEAIKQMRTWIFEVANVPDAETQYHANEFLDVAVQPKPIYISPNEVYSMHSLLSQNLERLAPSRDDPLRSILMELGGVPNQATEELNVARDAAITLELTNRFANVKDPHAEEKALWVQGKRAVLAILRVQPARDLVECLMQPVSEEHEMFWEDIVDRELMTDHMRQRQRRMPSTTGAESAYRLDDIRSLTFREVKAHAIYFLLELEKQDKVTREDGYQGILNAIAGDVRSKHRKRLQRQQELASMNEALQHLTDRKKYYEEQIKHYNNYIETAMNTMQKGKSKKRFVMPFTKQYFHLRDLQRSGKSAKFGSFRYSAQYLYDKGILLSIDKYSPRQFDRIDLVLASNKTGHFDIELHTKTLGISALVAETEIRMEDLLQAQFENRVYFPLFDGMAKFNLNLLLYQINKKFYV
ncbi:hypothetical protein DFH11DRAFT_1602139 [Phellopilus nigrolimitatus]|nr:hypothetical protein DFH11DRAFT_1602139 [Phellopilus nigrolimitatus]